MAGFISDKSKCSGITCWVMLVVAAPLVRREKGNRPCQSSLGHDSNRD